MILTLCSLKGNPCKVQRALSTRWQGPSQARVLGAGSGKGKGRFFLPYSRGFFQGLARSCRKSKTNGALFQEAEPEQLISFTKPFLPPFLKLEKKVQLSALTAVGARRCLHARGARVPVPGHLLHSRAVSACGWLISVRASCACANLECPVRELFALVLSVLSRERRGAWTGCCRAEPPPRRRPPQRPIRLPHCHPFPFFKMKQIRN